MRHEFKAFVKVSDDGKSTKMFGGSIKEFFALHPGETFIIHAKKNKTSPQNKYFWVLMTILGNEIGMTKEQAHDIMCYKFLLEEEVNEKTGETFQRIRGTSELSKAEMMHFIDQIIVYCADQLHIVLPSPGEVIKMNF